MNFKDAYKSYNDEIRSNPDVLKTILQSDVAPKHVFNYRMAFSYAAMLALVVSVSVFSYNHFQKSQEPTVRYIAANGDSKIQAVTASDATPADNSDKEEIVAMTELEKPNRTDGAKSVPQPKPDNNFNNIKPKQQPEEKIVSSTPSHQQDEASVQSSNKNADDTEKTNITADESIQKNNTAKTDEETKMPMALNDNSADENAPEEKITTNNKPLSTSNSSAKTVADNDEAFVTPKAPENKDEKSKAEDEETAEIPSGKVVSHNHARIAHENVPDEAFPADDSGVAVVSLADDEVAALSIEDDDTCYMSYGEYKEYIGLDIQAKAKLPADMIFEPMPSAKVEYENDTIVSDTFTASAFSVENPQRSLTVSVSKNGTLGTDNANTASASANVGDVSVRVDAENVTKEEIDTLVNSLK